MKVNILWTTNMVMENFDGQAEIFTKEIIQMTKDMAMAKCIGLMEAFTKGNGQKEFSMDMGRCTFQMVQRKLEFLKTMFSKEAKNSLNLLTQNRPFRRKRLYLDQHPNLKRKTWL